MEQWVTSEKVSTVPLPGSGSGAGGDYHKEGYCTSVGRAGDLVWPEAQLLGEGAVPTHITFFAYGARTSPLPQAGTRWRQWHPEHISREAPDSFQKLSAQEGLLGGKWIIINRLPVGLGKRGAGNPTSGKASPGNHLNSGGKSWGSGRAPEREEGKGGPQLICAHQGGQAQSLIQGTSRLLSDRYLAAPNSANTNGHGKGEAMDTGAICFQFRTQD